MAGFEKEDLVISCEEYNIEGIPCIKADIETEQYESYLAIVPGEFWHRYIKNMVLNYLNQMCAHFSNLMEL